MFSLDKANPCLDKLFWMLPVELQKYDFVFETSRTSQSDFGGSPYVGLGEFWCVNTAYDAIFNFSPLITQEFNF